MINEALHKDYPALIEIWESAVRATHDFLSEEDLEYYKSRLPLYFQYVSLFVFKENETIKGFLGVSEDKIEMLFIDNKSRGQGVGKILLNYAINELNIRKVDVNEQNIQAMAFYEHFGFKKYERSELDSEGKNYPVLYLSL
jgi:putative acetyltransferase